MVGSSDERCCPAPFELAKAHASRKTGAPAISTDMSARVHRFQCPGKFVSRALAEMHEHERLGRLSCSAPGDDSPARISDRGTGRLTGHQQTPLGHGASLVSTDLFGVRSVCRNVG